MGNGTYSFKNEAIKKAYTSIVNDEYSRKRAHWSLKDDYFATIVKGRYKDPSIYFYNFKRSVKPLAKIIENGEIILIRDFFEVTDLLDVIKNMQAEVKAWIRINDEFKGKNLCLYPPVSIAGSACETPDLSGLVRKLEDGVNIDDVEIKAFIIRGSSEQLVPNSLVSIKDTILESTV